MKATPDKINKLMIFLFAIIFQFSCSKDSDLLADYVISDANASLFVANLAIDDYFVVAKDNEIVLDVLSNDSYEDPNSVSIVKVSQPVNGTVIINEDKTLTYIPEHVDAPTESTDIPKTKTPQESVGTDESVEETSTDVPTEPTQQEETPEESQTPAVSETPEETTAPAEEASPKENQSPAEEKESTTQSFTYVTETVNQDQTTETSEATVTVTNDPNQVNFSKYGAVGDGKTDDTKAISGSSL